MIEHLTNGRPVLLDHNGRPMRPDGDARPGGIALPHAITFVARQTTASNTYWHDRFDEAMRHARSDANAMRNDAGLMALLEERQRAVISLPWDLKTPDEKDPFQERVRGGLKRIIEGLPNLYRWLWWWTEAIWYGRYGVQVEPAWCTFLDRKEEGDPGTPRRGLTIADAWPVNGDKIGHQLDHTPYVLVSPQYASTLPNPELLLTTTAGRGLALRGGWAERFVIHRHLMEDADFLDADRAEAIHGVGIRSKLFWLNWLKMEWLGSVTDFFDRVGMGVTIWTYPRGNPQARADVEEAARTQSSRAHVFVPVDPDDAARRGSGVERMEVPTSGADALGKLVEYVDRQIERYVVGQEGSSKGSSSGLGNEASAEFQRDTKLQITKQDANFLAATLSGDARHVGLVSLIQKYTFPEADFPVRWEFKVEPGESEKKITSGKTLVELGVKVKADEMRAAAGYSKPAEGDELVEPPQPQGQPGAPGDPAAGGDPLAALAGGGGPGGAPESALEGATPGAGPPGGPEAAPDTPESAPERALPGGGRGDFLDALRAMREAADAIRYSQAAPKDVLQQVRGLVEDVLQYAWENRGKAKDGRRNRWYNTDSHETRYQIGEPGTGRPRRADQPAAAPRSAPKPARPSPDRVAGLLEGLNSADVTAEHVHAVTQALMGLTLKEMHQLRERLGVTEKGLKSATKGKLAGRLTDAAQGKAPPSRGGKASRASFDPADPAVENRRLQPRPAQGVPGVGRPDEPAPGGDLGRAGAKDPAPAPVAPPVAPAAARPGPKQGDQLGGAISGMKPGSPTPMEELRAASGLPKADFDAAVMRAADAGLIHLHPHNYPAALDSAARDRLVKDGDDYYAYAVRNDDGDAGPSPFDVPAGAAQEAERPGGGGPADESDQATPADTLQSMLGSLSDPGSVLEEPGQVAILAQMSGASEGEVRAALGRLAGPKAAPPPRPAPKPNRAPPGPSSSAQTPGPGGGTQKPAPAATGRPVDVDALATVYDRAASYHGRPDDLARDLEPLSRASRTELLDVAKRVGMAVSPSTGRAALEKGIRDRVVARAGMYGRAKIIDRPEGANDALARLNAPKPAGAPRPAKPKAPARPATAAAPDVAARAAAIGDMDIGSLAKLGRDGVRERLAGLESLPKAALLGLLARQGMNHPAYKNKSAAWMAQALRELAMDRIEKDERSRQ